MFYSEAN
jgi:uncharacterized protein YkuJ